MWRTLIILGVALAFLIAMFTAGYEDKPRTYKR